MYLFCFGATTSSAQRLVLALYSEINTGRFRNCMECQGIQVGCMQGKYPTHCTMPLAPVPHLCIFVFFMVGVHTSVFFCLIPTGATGNLTSLSIGPVLSVGQLVLWSDPPMYLTFTWSIRVPWQSNMALRTMKELEKSLERD